METATPPATLTTGTALAAMLEDGSFIIAALADDVPDTIEVWPNGDAALAWTASAVSWPLARPAEGARSGFVAVFPLPARVRPSFRSVTVSFGGRSLNLPLTLAPGGANRLFQALSDAAGGAFAVVVDSLVEILVGEGTGPARTRAVVGLVSVAARRAGVVEAIGETGEGAIYLQGWAADLKPERYRLLAACEPPLIADFSCAAFARQDLGDRGTGFAGVFEAPVPDSGASLRQLFYRADAGWRSLEIYQRRATLTASELPAHVRTLLPQANGPQDVMARLRALASRFDGRETISQVREPVRIGVDFALRAEGGGILVAGWLLDPKALVRAVRICGGGSAVRIDGDWSRMGRDDVSAAFANDPLFQGLALARVPAGFIAFAPKLNGEGAHIEIDLGDGAPRYFPLTVSAGSPRKMLARLIASVDPRSSAALHAVERQFGPMLRAGEAQASAGPAVETFGPESAFEHAPVSLIIGADDRVAEATSLFAMLAADPATRALPIVLAAPAGAVAAVAGEIARLAEFYRLAVRLVQTDGGDAFDCMAAGVMASASDTLIVMTADVLPVARGWTTALTRTYRQHNARSAVSPTILFEDGSVRWAGAWLEEEEGRSRLATPHIGFPASAVAGKLAQEVSTATLECCVLPRAAFAALAGAGGAYLGAAARNLDLALRLRVAGTPAVWAPDVTMVAASEAVPTQGLQLARQIDRWSLDHRWALPIAGLVT